jgi:hypothetical protein
MKRALTAGVFALAALAWTGIPTYADGPKDASPTAEGLPEAQSGQIALPDHPREPKVSPLVHRPGPPPTPHLLDQFELAFLVGGVHPTGAGAGRVSDGTQMGIQAAYCPSPRQAFGVTYVHNELDTPDGSTAEALKSITEVSFFGKALLDGDGALSPYLRFSTGFYTSRELVPLQMGRPGAGGIQEVKGTGLGLGAGIGVQLRTGSPAGWFLEARYAGDMLGAPRHSALLGFRGGMSFIFGGHRGVR